MWPALPAIIGAGADLAGLLLSHRWAGNAHQREVRDLSAAGLNPMLGMSGMGAPIPDVSSFGLRAEQGAQIGLELSTLEERTKLLSAKVDESIARAQNARTQAEATEALMPVRMALMQGELRVENMRADQMIALMPLLIGEAEAHIKQMAASARSLDALSVLQEYRATGELNEQKFELDMGEYGPVGRFILQIFRALK